MNDVFDKYLHDLKDTVGFTDFDTMSESERLEFAINFLRERNIVVLRTKDEEIIHSQSVLLRNNMVAVHNTEYAEYLNFRKDVIRAEYPLSGADPEREEFFRPDSLDGFKNTFNPGGLTFTEEEKQQMRKVVDEEWKVVGEIV